MNKRSVNFSVYKLCLTTLWISLLFSLLGLGNAFPVRAQSPEICILDGTVQIPLQGLDSLRSALAMALGDVDFHGAECFAPIDLRDEGEWQLFTFIGLVGVRPGSEWTASSNGVWSDLVLIHLSGTATEAAVAGTAEFAQLLEEIPESIFSPDAKRALDPLVPNLVTNQPGPEAAFLGSYIFPFENNRLVKFFRFHFNTTENYPFWTGANSKAVDLGSDGNTGVNHAPNRLLAAASGWVRHRCSEEGTYASTYLAVENDDGANIVYAHINKAGAPAVGTRILQGQYLGTLRTGSFSDGVCGHATQGSGEFHVHFEVPNTSSLTLSDWTLSAATGTWTRGTETWTAGQYKQVNSGTCPAPSLISPSDGFISSSQSVTFSWSAVSGCGSGYTFRIKDTANMDSGGTVVDGIDRGVGETFTTQPISSQWNNRDLYWGVRVANALGAPWSVRKFRIQPGSQIVNWTADFYDTTDRWFDPNNSSNFKCRLNLGELPLDENYGSGAPCAGMDGETWVGDYTGMFDFPSASYVFRVEHDDGLRLWLNDQNIADRNSSGSAWICSPRALSGNNTLRVRLREDGGDARVKVSWTTDTSVCTPSAPILNLTLGTTLKNRPVTIEVRNADPLLDQLFGPLFTGTQTSNANGVITNFSMGSVSPGNYKLFVKPAGWLRREKQVALVSGANSVDMQASFTDSAGDINGNNRVDILDFQLLSNDFGTTTNPRSDLNSDLRTDILDFQLLSNGFGKSGAGDEILLSAVSGAMTPGNSSQGQLILVPSTNAPQVGDVITLDLDFDTAALPMAALTAIIDYDQCVLQPKADQIVHSGLFATTAVVSNPGTLEYSAHKWTGVTPGTAVSGTGNVASIPFQVIASVPSTTVAIRFRPQSTYLSNMARDDIVQPFLSGVGQAVLHPMGTITRASQSAEMIRPVSGEIIRQNVVLLEADVSDACNGIHQVTFSVFHDGQWHSVATDRNGTDGWAVYWDASQVADQVIQVKAFAGDFAGNGVQTAVIGNITLDRRPVAHTVFNDVQTNYWAREFIERLYSAGITGGCSTVPLNYCPEQSVTRAQMAVFLLRGIHGASYTPPGVGAGTGFADVPPSYWAAAFVKQLAAEGVTTGCGSGNYCPEAPVTRAQMAVFLLRSKYGASYIPPAAGSDTGFADVPSAYWAASWIKQLVAEGITAGCGTGTYCPEAPVTRAQMAVFLVRTFSLP